MIIDVLAKRDAEHARRYTEGQLMREGAAAYRVGLALSACPPFKSDAMAGWWCQGWRNERDRAAAHNERL